MNRLIPHMFDSTHLYSALEVHRALISPLHMGARMCKDAYKSSLNPASYTLYGRNMAAACELVERMTQSYIKPEFGIDHVEVNGQQVQVKQRAVRRRTWCNLLHFDKEGSFKKQPKILIVAPMSGHFATLCRGTVRDLLPYADVYITDWVNARDVPLSKPGFDLDDYIDYLISFFELLGPDLHIIGICQPSVPVLAAVSLMASGKMANQPASMTLIGGPIDTRKSPTEVNRLAEQRSLKWFEKNVISRVPANYPGFMRKVYPGFLQLTGFMTMNLDRHIEAHMDLFNHLVEGDGDSATQHKDFYNEYLAVMDITAEFYLQTIHTVFQDHALPNGTMVSRGRPVRPQDITKTWLLALEGEKDDISGTGQTKAAVGLCTGLPTEKRWYRLQKDVGHYGLFNGRRFRNYIVPYLLEFMGAASGKTYEVPRQAAAARASTKALQMELSKEEAGAGKPAKRKAVNEPKAKSDRPTSKAKPAAKKASSAKSKPNPASKAKAKPVAKAPTKGAARPSTPKPAAKPKAKLGVKRAAKSPKPKAKATKRK